MTFFDEIKLVKPRETIKIGKNEFIIHHQHPDLSLVCRSYMYTIEIKFGQFFLNRSEWNVSCDMWDIFRQDSFKFDTYVPEDVTRKNLEKLLKQAAKKKVDLAVWSKKKMF